MTSLNPVDFGTSLSSIGDATSTQAQAGLKTKARAKAAAQNFELMFLSNTFEQMFTKWTATGHSAAAAP